MIMRTLTSNTMPLAILIFAALLFLTRLAGAQNDQPSVQNVIHPGLIELQMHEQQARERHERELQALDQARQALLQRQTDMASPESVAIESSIPGGALGIVHVDRPRQMTLLHLRGLAGSGSALLRLDDHCISLPLRLIAGDFGGESISAGRTAPIRIAVRSHEALEALLKGEDLISELYNIAHETMSAHADLVLLDGLTLQHGFVINPGRSLLDDIFGVQGIRVPCDHERVARN